MAWSFLMVRILMPYLLRGSTSTIFFLYHSLGTAISKIEYSESNSI